MNENSHPARVHRRTRIPRELDGELLEQQARGMTSGGIRDWLAATHGIVVTTNTIVNQLQRLRGARAATVLVQAAPVPTGMTHDEVIQMAIDAEVSVFRAAVSVPERRAAAKELRAWIELVRHFPGTSSPGSSNAEQSAVLSEILVAMRRLQLSQPINMPVAHDPSDSAENPPVMPVNED